MIWWVMPVLGLVVGSFLATLARRLPQQATMVGRSRCDRCRHDLGQLDLIPIVSWLALRRRCRYCATTISGFYPAMEIAACVVGLWAAVAVPPDMLWQTCLLGWTLLALAVIDWRTLLLPNVLTLPLAGLGLVIIGLLAPSALAAHAVATGTGFLVFIAIAYIYRRMRGIDGLGPGDAKLFAAGGAWVGLTGLWSVLLIASLSALVWAGMRCWRQGRIDPRARLPFGSFLCGAIWLVWLYGPLQFG